MTTQARCELRIRCCWRHPDLVPADEASRMPYARCLQLYGRASDTIPSCLLLTLRVGVCYGNKQRRDARARAGRGQKSLPWAKELVRGSRKWAVGGGQWAVTFRGAKTSIVTTYYHNHYIDVFRRVRPAASWPCCELVSCRTYVSMMHDKVTAPRCSSSGVLKPSRAQAGTVRRRCSQVE